MTLESNQDQQEKGIPMTVKDYVTQSSPSKITGVHMFIMVVMMFLGFALGQITGLDQYKKLVTERIESDVYATLEFASLNSMAVGDLSFIEKELDAIKQVTADESVKLKVEALSKQLVRIKSVYTKRRSEFQKELASASQQKGLLFNAIEKNSKESKEIKVSLAELYLLRLMELLNKEGVKKLSDMPPADKELISRVVENIVSLSPPYKETIVRLFPEVGKEFLSDKEKDQ